MFASRSNMSRLPTNPSMAITKNQRECASVVDDLPAVPFVLLFFLLRCSPAENNNLEPDQTTVQSFNIVTDAWCWRHIHYHTAFTLGVQ